ncbi:hypothetical protein EJD97_006083, partial [Solanum chilense]
EDFVSHVATDRSSIATYDLSVERFVSHVATDESVVHPWITPIEEELQLPYLITLGLIETIFAPFVDRVKMVLVGPTAIKRDQLHNEVVNELVVFDGDAVAGGIGPAAGAGVGVCVAVVAGADAGQHEGNISCR